MRTLSTFIQDQLSSYASQAFFMVDIVGTGVDYHVTTLPYDVASGGVAYTRRPMLMAVSPPRFSSEVDRAVYTMQFSDPDGSVETLLANAGYACSITTRLGFLDPFSNQPNLDDFLTVYQGLFDSMALDTSNNQRMLLVNGASPMSALDSTNAIYTDEDWSKSRNASDTSMSFVTKTVSQEITLLWGKSS
jgi:hypothetical protein